MSTTDPSDLHVVRTPCTGQTALFCNQVQPWALQTGLGRDIECYCLDAPDTIPSGRVRFVGGRFNGRPFVQSLSTCRD